MMIFRYVYCLPGGGLVAWVILVVAPGGGLMVQKKSCGLLVA
jgi:hypothetical protein